MSSAFRMPSLGTDMEDGTLVQWIKQPGERVERGEAIAAVETQKGAIEIESFESGVLERTEVAIGQRVPVGTVLAWIRADGEDAAAPAAQAPPPASPAPAVAAAATSAATSAPTSAPISAHAPKHAPASASAATSAGVRYTPAALGRARALGLDPTAIVPGTDGIVGLREVEQAAGLVATAVPAAAPTAPAVAIAAPAAAADRTSMRAAIAAAMSRAWREIPHYSVSSTLDLEPLLGWLAAYNADRPVPERLHYAAALAKAVALALKASPALNGHVLADGFVAAPRVHLGIALALRGGGLVTPAILDADALPLPTLMAQLDGLVERARGGRLRSSELGHATATLSILGEHTADAMQPVIHPPEVAIVGCGQVRERAWAEHGALSARRCLTVTVAGDHRVSDGRVAARFLATLATLLRQPERL